MKTVEKLRPIGIEEAREDYERLKELDCEEKPGLSRVGLKALDRYFFTKRLRAKTKKHISFMNALKNREGVWRYVEKKTRKIKRLTAANKRDPVRLLRKQYDVFQLYYGTINQFRPSVARWLYCKLGAKLGVLDFSAGWGGRALAAMSLGLPYMGVDANKGLAGSYKKMVKELDADANVTLVFKPAEETDWSRWKYDLVFTSPPYFTLEEYEHMPAYGSREGFIEKFFRPVVLRAWKGLAKGGHMALNMPAEMYEAIRGDIPVKASRLALKLQDRHAAAAMDAGEFAGSAASEWIYVWKKS